MEKQKIQVTIAGRNYTLVSADPPEYVKRVAEHADRRLREMAAVSGQPPAQVAVLTCLNLTDDLMRAKDENTALKRRLAELNAQRR